MKLQVFGSPYKKDVVVGTEQSGTITLQSIKGRSVGEAKEIGELENRNNSYSLDTLILVQRISKIRKVPIEQVQEAFKEFDLTNELLLDFLPEIKELLANQGGGTEARVLAVTLMIRNRLVVEENDNRKVGCPEWTTEDSCSQLSEELANEVYSFYLAESARKPYVPSDKLAEGNEPKVEKEIAIMPEVMPIAS